MSIEVVSRCDTEQLLCSACRNTSCKCTHPRNDIILQRLHRLGLCLPVSPLCHQTPAVWKSDDPTVVICTKHHQEARNEEETFTHIHSTLPTVESEDSSDEEEYEDDMVVDDDLQGGLNTFTAVEGVDTCTALPRFHQRKISTVDIPSKFASLMDRKLSDPAVMVRKESISSSQRQHRRFSDGNLGFNAEEEWSEEGSSHLGCDSGYNDDIRSKFRGSAFASPAHSDVDLETVFPKKVRRLTPLPLTIEKDARQLVVSDAGCGSHFVLMEHQPKRPFIKQHSVHSIGDTSVGGASTGTSTGGASSESSSMNSLWECDSPETITDILSGLGFDDFDNPQLIPDRFIPPIIEHAKPSVMRLQLLTEEVGLGPGTLDQIDLPLGATAETYLQKPTTPPASPPHLPFTDPVTIPQPHSSPIGTRMDPAISQFVRSKAILESVPEETASDLSPSPRWFSPRVSIDHSVDLLDLQEGKLGSALLQKQRKRSLPQREGYKHSIGSQVESEPDSIYFSVTSYDEDVAREREREREELCPPLPLDDPVQQRRRRRGVYTPPPGLVWWLSSHNPISEEEQDPDELPWPFSEQARLRKSLSEIEQAQKSPLYEPITNDGCGQESAPLVPIVRTAVSPCRSPQLSDSDGLSHQSSHSGPTQRYGGDSPCCTRDDPVDTRRLSLQEGEYGGQEGECGGQEGECGGQEGECGGQDVYSDTIQPDMAVLRDKRSSFRHTRLSWQKAEDTDFMMGLLEAI